jgi:Zn-dependent peptidase ImmA (M78 family)
MVTSSRVEISRQIYLWAVRESQKDLDEIRSRFKRIDTWISGQEYPTFRQVEQLAKFLSVPLGYMFLEQPPKERFIESEFRTIGNKIPRMSKELQDTLYIMARRKDWLSEHRQRKGWMKLLSRDFSDLSETNMLPAKEYLGLDEFWYKKHRDKKTAFKYLRGRLEDIGIIVMQNGIVGSHTRRKLDVHEFRGFLLYDDYAPLIFINGRDSDAGKIFTVIHEYIHYLLQEDDIFVDKDGDETKINLMTAEFLIPTSHVQTLWDNSKAELEQITGLSKLFHVSELAMAIKLKQLGRIAQHIVNEVKQRAEEAVGNKGSDSEGSGGDYYLTNKNRISETFARAVVEAAESGDITYTYAFDLLGGSAKLYDYFKEEFMTYGQ